MYPSKEQGAYLREASHAAEAVFGLAVPFRNASGGGNGLWLMIQYRLMFVLQVSVSHRKEYLRSVEKVNRLRRKGWLDTSIAELCPGSKRIR